MKEHMKKFMSAMKRGIAVLALASMMLNVVVVSGNTEFSVCGEIPAEKDRVNSN